MTKLKISQICFLLMWLMIQPEVLNGAEPITVKVSAATEIDTDEIYLREIGEFHGNNPELIQKLKTIVIASSPLAGKEKPINSGLIRLRLKQNDIDPEQINLLVPDDAVATRKAIEISTEEIRKIVKDYLHKNMPWDLAKVQIKDIDVDNGVTLPKGEINYRVVLPPKTAFLGVTPLSVTFSVNGNFKKKVWATAHIAVLEQVVVTDRPLGKYKVITEDDISKVEMDLAKLPSDVVKNETDVVGKRTTRPMDAHSVLRPDFVELPFLIKRGAIVSVIADSETLRVVTLGKAKERGRKGQMIKVENLDSKKSIYARVLDTNSVLVEF